MSGRPRRMLISPESKSPSMAFSSPLKSSRKSTLSENSDSLRRSPRLSEQRDVGPKVANKRIPTPPRAQKSRLLIAINETVTSSTGFNRTEFSDDDETFHNHVELENCTSKSSAITERDFGQRFRDGVSNIGSSITERTSDFYYAIKLKFWDGQSENFRRSIVAFSLLLLLLPFALPHYKHYATVISDQSRVIFLSVPDFLAGAKSSDLLGVPAFFSFESESSQTIRDRPQHQSQQQQHLDVQSIVEKMISNPKFIEIVKFEQSKHTEGLKPTVTDEEQRIVELINKFKAEIDQRNSDLSSKLEILKVEVDGKLDEVAGKIPNFGSQLDSISNRAAEMSRQLDLKLSKLDQELGTTRSDLNKLKSTKIQSTEDADVTVQIISQLEQRLQHLSQEYKLLTASIQGCQTKYLTIEDQVEAMVTEILSQTNDSSRDAKITSLINEMTSRFVSDADLKERMEIWRQKLGEEFEQEVQVMVAEKVQSNLQEKADTFEEIVYKRVSEDLTKSQTSFSKDEITRIVQDALMTYDADKTGLFDFALESAGGTIASTRCTETYDLSNAVYSVWGVPIWWTRNNPRTILQPGSSPGQCWAFRGSQGSVVINLSSPIIMRAVTLEHIPASLAPDGSISSAPKKFEVYGLRSLNDENPENLGNFTYSDVGPPVQTFYLATLPKVPFTLVEFKVLSNYGNMIYTCIYRFRIHGKLE